MKTVLLISHHHPELTRGGSQQVCYELFQELQEHPDVRCFLLASAHDSQPALFKPGAHITGFDGRQDEFLFLPRDYDRWWHRTSDPELIGTFIELLQTIRPDVVHFHHFLTFGIDCISIVRRILPECRIVLTLHDFHAICAADGYMVRRADGSLCDRATQVRCHQCFPDRGPEEFALRRLWFMRHLGNVDNFVCPSRFMIEHFIRAGFPRDRFVHIPNGQRRYGARQPAPPLQLRFNRFGFFGQLTDAKGLHILLRAVQILRAEEFTGFRVEVNGANIETASGAIKAEIERTLAVEAALPIGQRIVFQNGPYQVEQLRSRMVRLDWCVMPSVWWEVFGLVISEAWMFGKPVICSNVGGMAERVTHDVNGLHFEMGDPDSLAAAIRRACTEEGLWERLCAALPEPPSRTDMTKAYLEIYRGVSAQQAA